MSGEVVRPSETRTLANAVERIRILEALVPAAGGGGTTICTGCYDVDPDFADCADLTPGTCVDVDHHDPLSFNPTDPEYFAESANGVGPYLCNYGAGFRVQVRYVGPLKRAALWGTVVHDPSVPGATGWTSLPTPIGNTTLIDVDTGWVTLDLVPGTGALGDDWSAYLGWTNGSIIADGEIGPGSFCARYVSAEDLTNYVPQPQNEGAMLIALGSPPVWVTLAPGTAGQVLTMSGGLPTWV